MLRIAERNLTQDLIDYLQGLQDAVNLEVSREDKIDKAKDLFDKRGRMAGRRYFQAIADTLSIMAPPFRRCYYCEDSEHRDVEHIRPKRHYPDLCFSWINYAYACPICNNAKSDTVALFTKDDETFELFTRAHPKSQPLPAGDQVLIDPRTENPLDHIKLDLITGNLVPISSSGRSYSRARHTIDLLKLNRDAIRRNRYAMVRSYISYLEVHKISIDNNDGRADRIVNEILRLPQPTVFAELKRQKEDFPEIKALIDKLPILIQ